MKVIEYGRVSTDKQTLEQQNRTVKEWLSRNGLKTDIVITEEGISGGVTYKKRKLGTDVLPLLEAGDMLIVACGLNIIYSVALPVVDYGNENK